MQSAHSDAACARLREKVVHGEQLERWRALHTNRRFCVKPVRLSPLQSDPSSLPSRSQSLHSAARQALPILSTRSIAVLYTVRLLWFAHCLAVSDGSALQCKNDSTNAHRHTSGTLCSRSCQPAARHTCSPAAQCGTSLSIEWPHCCLPPKAARAGRAATHSARDRSLPAVGGVRSQGCSGRGGRTGGAYSDILRRVDDTERCGVVNQVCRVVLRVARQAHLESEPFTDALLWATMADGSHRWLNRVFVRWSGQHSLAERDLPCGA